MPAISRKRILSAIAIVAALLLVYTCYYVWQVVVIGAAYKAKVLCSSVFLSKRNPQDILREDLEGILSIIDAEIDFETKSVTTSFPGVPSQRAIFRDGLGCTLLAGASDVEVLGQTRNFSMNALTSSARPSEKAGFRGFAQDLPPEVSLHKLTEAIDKAFFETDPGNPIRTRAVVVVYHGQIIAERYAPGISPDTALPGWSMTKSVTGALVGIFFKRESYQRMSPFP